MKQTLFYVVQRDVYTVPADSRDLPLVNLDGTLIDPRKWKNELGYLIKD